MATAEHAAARSGGMRARALQLEVGVVGCGLVGTRRCRAVNAHPRSRVTTVADPDEARARSAAPRARVRDDWRALIDAPNVDAVVVATPNDLLADVAVAALEAGKHVLMEKPMGRSLAEARRIAAAAERSGAVLRIGFNHRFHPAIRAAHAAVAGGELGRLITLRARYGHGGRPGLEREWRSDPVRAGGGELLDQGVHLADLFHWFAGMPIEAFAWLQTAAWQIDPLEDNAYGMLRFADGAIGQLHASMTQWKNLFCLEVHGETGAVVVEGLGGSYGTERLVRVRRAFQGGAPATEEHRFEGEDRSWADEWADFMSAIYGGDGIGAGPSDGIAAMRIINALYRAARAGAPCEP